MSSLSIATNRYERDPAEAIDPRVMGRLWDVTEIPDPIRGAGTRFQVSGKPRKSSTRYVTLGMGPTAATAVDTAYLAYPDW